MSGKITLKCFHCGTELDFIDRVGIRESCTKCNADAHVCKNCRFYDPKVYNECSEPSAEPVREKDRANMCDYFEPGSGAGGAAKTKDDLRAAAEALFKKK